ncbi:hypothetical protein SNE40_007450 [Patella caerulea]|uniref:Meckelin n=1 Tax=Patella caerulea TaxID=87958 RepID=A0AAN8JXY6_PATCE
MAANCLHFTFLILYFGRCTWSQSVFFNFKKPSDCQSENTPNIPQYYDISTLSCKDCSQPKTFQRTSSDGLRCECQPGYKHVKNFGGSEITCEACGANQAASDDGWECVSCETGFIPETKTCQGCQPSQVSVERKVDGNWATINTTVCQTCAPFTHLNADGSRCVRCNDVLSVRGDLSTCQCPNDENENSAGGYCFNAGDLAPDNNQLYAIPLEVGGSKQSYFFKQNVRSADVMCRVHKNVSACHTLANMCTLLFYDPGSSRTGSNQACTLLKAIPVTNDVKPEILIDDDAEDIIYNDGIPTSYTFTPQMFIKFKVARYSLEGNFLGFSDVTGGVLQLCENNENILNAAYVFGTVYSKSCSISARSFWDTTKYPLEFYDLYLEYEENAVTQLYTIPIRILNYRDLRSDEANREEIRKWQLVRRFFLVDNVATVTTENENATVVRYAKSIHLSMELQSETSNGKIYVPYFTIEYGEVDREAAESNTQVSVSFSVSYTMSQSKYFRDFQIAAGIVGSLSFLYAGYRTWVWSKRAGRISIDFATLMNFIFFLSAALSNCFFVVNFGIAFYWLVFFKRQDAAYLVHPSGQSLLEWQILFGFSFALKVLNVLHLIVMQCMVDIFFIDWERPVARAINNQSQDKRAGQEMPVSIWRTYFVANEWNELQGIRKINKIFQIFAVVFFLSVVGFENVTTLDPNGSVLKSDDDYKSETSYVFRYAIAVLVYLLVAVVQYIFFTFIYERFIEDKVRQFVDLCSMSNISVFIMSNARYGYYIHGRSVHGRADTNMKEMYDMMKKEEEDMCGKRGLEPNSEEQTFQMSIPLKLRAKYEQIYIPIALEKASVVGRMEQGKGRTPGSPLDKSIEAYTSMNKFLGAYIDHSVKDLDYKIIRKGIIENIMDTEFQDSLDQGILYNDNGHSFDQVLLFGNEITLILFDILFFCMVDHIATNFVLAGIITYLATELVTMIRVAGGKRNLARKTLVDERFLI